MSPTTIENTGESAGGATEDLERIAAALRGAAAELVPDATPSVVFEAPRNLDFGDFASNVALQLAKSARRAPQQLASELIERAFAGEPELRGLVAEAQAAGGFINIRMAPAYWQRTVAAIVLAGSAFGRSATIGERVSLEFGSANPTGPLVVVQGRTLSIGDSIARAMRFCGFDVTTEWIANDTGAQMDRAGRSLYARYRQLDDAAYPFPDDGYPGEYLVPIAQTLRAREGSRWNDAPESEWLPYFSLYARDVIIAQQQATCERFRVRYDRWQSEREMHESGAVSARIAILRGKELLYEKDGALWMRATDYGDDKDRVVIRSDGRPTYYAQDVAYHYDKLERTARAILILGPDHHGYIARLKALASAFGKPGAISVLIAQQMTIVRDGEVVSSSKRQGEVLTLDEIVDEVGVDAARFFFVMPSADSPVNFDLSLAVEQSSENPVYYVQYGHARIASIERKAPPDLLARATRAEALERLTEPSELALARRLSEFPAIVRSVVDGLAPHRLARYLQSVAADFHQFYMNCTVLGEDAELSVARLALSHATKTVLASGLDLLGVSAPDAMERS